MFILFASSILYSQKQIPLTVEEGQALLEKDNCEEVISRLSPKQIYSDKDLHVLYIQALELCNHDEDAFRSIYNLLGDKSINKNQRARLHLTNARLNEKFNDEVNTKKALDQTKENFTKNTPSDILQIWNVRMASYYRVLKKDDQTALGYAKHALNYNTGEIGSAYYLNSYLSKNNQQKYYFLNKAIQYYASIDSKGLEGMMYLGIIRTIPKEFFKNNEYDQYFKKAKSILPKSKNIRNKAIYYIFMSQHYHNKKEYKNASIYKDSLLIVYEKISISFDKRKIEIARKNDELIKYKSHLQEKEKWNNVYLLISSVLLVLSIIAVMFYFKIRKRKNLMKLESSYLEKHNHELKNSLDYNNVLLQETNHRVKNNLMLLSGIIHIDINKSEDDQLKKKLHDINQRIHNISVIHKHIYESNNYSRLELKQVLAEVINNIKGSIQESLKNNITFSCEDFSLETSETTPLIIILNELISNSIKYALKTENDFINITLKTDDKFITIAVTDSGKGYDTNNIEKNKSGIGMFLVEILVQQLKGFLTFEKNNDCFTTYITINK